MRYVPLHEIAHDLPSSFPANPRQRCSYGAEVEITFRSGRVLTYGPCRRPAAIERLRLALIDASRHPHVTAHYVTTPGTVALLAEGAGASGGAAVPHPSLTLSRSSGSAGTRVFIVGRGCIKPVGQPDVLAWHDHYYWRHDIEKRPPLGVWRAIPLVRTSMTTVRSIFVVRRTEHLGRGLLDLMCRTGGNAIATFVVTR